MRRAEIRDAARAAPTVEAKNLVRVLGLYADPQAVVRVSLATLAADVGIDERNVRRQLRLLEAYDCIVPVVRSQGGRGLTNRWRVVVPDDQETRTPTSGFSGEKPGHERPETRIPVSENPDTGAPRRGIEGIRRGATTPAVGNDGDAAQDSAEPPTCTSGTPLEPIRNPRIRAMIEQVRRAADLEDDDPC